MLPSSLPSLLLAAAGAVVKVPPTALAALSAAVLLLLLEHRRSNLGARAAWAFLGFSCGYGLLRSWSIRTLSEAHLGGAPYRLSAPLFTLAGVPLQELLGWTVAAGLAGYFADRLLRRFGTSTDPYRGALLAGLGMAAVCLAVETAAVLGGWWSWSLAHSKTGFLVFPGIALVDWGFVAIDFLLPFELWRQRAPRRQRWLSLLLFPIHLGGHAFTQKLPGPLPLSLFDLVHVGLLAGVAAAAAATLSRSEWPPLADEKQRAWPLLATAILTGTAGAQILFAGEAARLWVLLPLLAVAVAVAVFRREAPATRAPLAPNKAWLIFAGLLLAGLLLRLPEALRSRDFEKLLRQAAASLVAKDADSAIRSLDAALELRPNHSEALWLLGWAELQKGERVKARQHLEAALALRPDAQDAARLLALLDQAEARANKRRRRALFDREIHQLDRQRPGSVDDQGPGHQGADANRRVVGHGEGPDAAR